jgi:lactoylglutathione lyase
MRVVTSKHQLTGLSHVGIRVGKLAPARAFYEKIGFRFVMGPIGNEPVAIMDHPSGLCLNLVINAVTSGDPNILMDVAEKHPGFTHVALFVEDLRLTEQFLIDEGIIITEGPVTFPDGTRALFLRDPDGNVIEFDQKPLPS